MTGYQCSRRWLLLMLIEATLKDSVGFNKKKSMKLNLVKSGRKRGIIERRELWVVLIKKFLYVCMNFSNNKIRNFVL